MNRCVQAIVLLAAVLVLSGPGVAEERKGKPSKDAGWRELFNGKNLGGWQNSEGGKPGAGWVVESGAVCRTRQSGDLWTRERFGNFILDLEFKTKGNSGIF